MKRNNKITSYKITALIMLALGISLIVLSLLYASSFLAILGLALIFWGVIFLYIMPTKHVPLTILNALCDMGNTERIIDELDLKLKGIYLPPHNLKKIDSSLIFIPIENKISLPLPEETENNLFNKTRDGVFLNPPGDALCRLFEKEIGTSFSKINLTSLQAKLPKILYENLELAENVEMQTNKKTITINITNSLLDQICIKTQNYPRTHVMIGCVLSSALACALAKATGEPITIEEETRKETNTTQIIYKIQKE